MDVRKKNKSKKIVLILLFYALLPHAKRVYWVFEMQQGIWEKIIIWTYVFFDSSTLDLAE